MYVLPCLTSQLKRGFDILKKPCPFMPTCTLYFESWQDIKGWFSMVNPPQEKQARLVSVWKKALQLLLDFFLLEGKHLHQGKK